MPALFAYFFTIEGTACSVSLVSTVKPLFRIGLRTGPSVMHAVGSKD